MKPILIALLVAASLCFAEKPEEVQKAIPDTITVHRVILDSVTIKALENSQTFYDSALKDIQNSHSSFLNKITIIVGILGVIIAVSSIIITIILKGKYSEAKKYNEDLKEEVNKVNNELESNKKDFENKISGLKNELKEQIEKQKMEFKLNKDDTFREIASSYVSTMGIATVGIDNDLSNVFSNFSYYYNILWKNNVDLNKSDSISIEYIKNIAKTTSSIELTKISMFLFSLEMFIEYCKDKNKKEHLGIASETMKLFYDKFGEKEVLAEIEKIKKQVGINP